jgi:hypothetical protein
MRQLFLVVPLLTASIAGAQEGDPVPTDSRDALTARLEALETELEVLKAESSAAMEDLTKEDPLRIYGFLEVGLQKMFIDRDVETNYILPSRALTFALGGANLYIDARPTRHWSALIETRFLLAPHGTDVPGDAAFSIPYTRNSTLIWDQSSAGGFVQVRWSALVMERAYVQYTHSERFQLRAGLFLTPLGIWNEDHGSPTLIPVVLPQSMVTEQFPIRQLGVQFLGSVSVSDWRLGYTAYVSNGRTPTDLDFTDGKAVGARVTLTAPRPMKLVMGASFYAGRYSDTQRNVVQQQPLLVETTEVVAYRETTGGLDLSADFGDFRLRTELSGRIVRYEEGKRDLQFGIEGIYAADHLDVDWYGLLSWRPVSWFEPYVFLEVYRWPNLIAEGFIMPSIGMNFHFTPTTQLKLQAAPTIFLDFGSFERVSHDHSSMWTGARLVQAF